MGLAVNEGVLNVEMRELKDLLQSARALVGASPRRARVMRMLRTIEEVFDIANGGDHTFAGIILHNIVVMHDHVRMSTCKSKQRNLWKFPKEGVDLTSLPGMERFLYKILNKTERELFVNQLREMLGENDPRVMRSLVCKDFLIRAKEHQHIQRRQFRCFPQRGGGGEDGLFVKIDRYNPIFSPTLCDKPEVRVAYTNMQLQQKIRHTKARLRKTLERVRLAVSSMVNARFDLAHIQAAEQEAKRATVAFSLQSLADYKNIFNTIRFYSNSK